MASAKPNDENTHGLGQDEDQDQSDGQYFYYISTMHHELC